MKKPILRWILVFPAALLGLILSPFVLHWVLYSILTGSGLIEPYPGTPERVLTPMAAALGFVLSGAHTAPTRKFGTSLVLAGAFTLLTASAALLAVAEVNIGGKTLYLQNGGVRAVLAILGALAGAWLVRLQAQNGSRK